MNKFFAIALTALSLTALATDDALDCERAISTMDINQCALEELYLAESEMEHYLEASYQHNDYDPELIAAIKTAQKAWAAYRTSHCDSVYTQWRDGTIRGVMGISCQTALTQQRTHEVWRHFLTYMDSTPPVLPEPGVSRDLGGKTH